MNMMDHRIVYLELAFLIFLVFYEKKKGYKFVTTRKKIVFSVVLYTAAFSIYFVRLLFVDSMAEVSGDAVSIWQTITTFYDDTVQSSYVLYKGMFAVYPYVWLYQLAGILGTGEFFFIKIYNALLFAYIAVLGMPHIFEKIFGKEIAMWKKWLFTISIFHLQAVNYAFYNISVDIPSLFAFVLLIDAVVCIWKSKKKSFVWESVAVGLASGASLCFSGQYKIAAVAGIVFALIVLLQKKEKRQVAVCAMLIAVCILGIRSADRSFVSRVVEPMRQSGEWLPSGADWVVSHVASYEPVLGYAYLSAGDFKDTQAINIISVEQPDYTACESTGEYIFLYLKTMLKHPVQFLASCGNKLFLAFCMDAGGVRKGGLIAGFVNSRRSMCNAYGITICNGCSKFCIWCRDFWNASGKRFFSSKKICGCFDRWSFICNVLCNAFYGDLGLEKNSRYLCVGSISADRND